MFGFGKARKQPQRRRLIMEQLEMRSVLSGVAMGALHTHVHHHDSDHHTTAAVHSASVANSIAAPHTVQQAQLVQHTQLAKPVQTVHSTVNKTGSHSEHEGNDGESGDSEGSETELSATLSDPSGASSATGSAKYSSEQEHGATAAHFSVNVKGATPGVSLDVSIDGVSVGTITPDANGNGSLKLSSNSKNGATSSLPTTVNAGSIVKVGDSLTGTLAASQDSANGESHERGD